jgi:hypothetical protein
MLNNDVVTINTHMVQEVVVETSTTSAESETGGVQINVIPRDGGNKFAGTWSSSWAGPSLAADNLTKALQDRGLESGASIKRFLDNGGGFGGPIKRDRLWFWTAHRVWTSSKYIQGAYYNANQGAVPNYVDADPVYNVTLYQPDLNRQAHTGWAYYNSDVRVTWQASPRNKVVGSFSRQSICNCPIQLSGTGGSNAIKRAPEAARQDNFVPMYLPSVKWTSPATNRLLFEASLTAVMRSIHSSQMDGVRTNDIEIQDLAQNIIYGSSLANFLNQEHTYNARFSMSYVTGSHTAKTGFTYRRVNYGKEGLDQDPDAIFGSRSYVFFNGDPRQVIIYALPNNVVENVDAVAAYAQDQWRVRKLTLNAGLRYDGFTGAVPAHHQGAGYFVPARDYPAVHNVPNFKNLNPRLSVVYDLFGNGKTALKASLGRYNPLGARAASNPLNNSASSVSRNWTDTNHNYVPDCDLNNPQPNGECGIWSDLSFGSQRPGTRYLDDALQGFNTQFYNWQSSVSVQHQLRPGMALNVGYFRTSYGNFLVTDNEALTAADFDSYCLTRPSTPALNGYQMPGAGQQLCGFYDLKPEAATLRPDLVRKLASDVGKRSEIYNGIDVTMNARFAVGGQFSGGLSMGRTTTDACDIARKAPETLLGTDGSAAGSGSNSGPGTLTTGVAGAWSSLEHCRVQIPWSAATQLKFLVVYPLPWDLQMSAIYQNMAGAPILATYPAPAAEVMAALPGNRILGACAGRPTCTANTTVSMLSLGQAYESRLQQLDLRFARRFTIGTYHLSANADLANVFNRADVYSANTGVGSNWLVPYEVAGGRLLRLSAQIEF